MTDVVITSEDVIVTVQQPVIPPSAPPVKIGLVEINQIVQRGSIWSTGSGAPTTPGNQVGDMYLNVDTGDIYSWNGTEWIFEGTFAPSTLTPAEILAALITVDGAGSGLDADMLDGFHEDYFGTHAEIDAIHQKDFDQDTSIGINTGNITNNANAIFDLQAATTPAALLTSIKTVDGAGSGLDADLLDTHDSAYFATQAALTSETNARTSADATHDTRLTAVETKNTQQDTAINLRLTDAPSDANAYARKGEAWVDATEEAPSDGLGYMRKNGAWAPSSGGATTDDLPPAGPLQDGQLWWKSSTGVFYIWYDDGNSQQWVQVSASPQTPMGDLKNVSSINGGPLAGFRNALVNPAFLVNQLGSAYSLTLAANVNWVDFWKAGPAGFTLSTSSSIATITAGTLVQIVDAVDMVAGLTYCINWFGTAPCTINGVAKNKGDTYVHASGNVTVSFGIGTVGQPQLEPGTMPTPFEKRPLGVEVAAAKWRFEEITICAGGYQGVGSVNFGGCFPYGPKRAVPTISTPVIITSSNVSSANFTNVSLNWGATYSIVGISTGAATVLAVAVAAADARL